MNKKEYAIFHYLLAKIKYDLVENRWLTRNPETRKACDEQITAIETIEKICTVDFGDKK